MALNAVNKAQIVKDFQRFPNDTGSPEVQIALLSANIASLGEHFKTHKKDYHSRRGLMTMVNQRRRLLEYLKHINRERYQTVVAKLGLRH